MPYVTIPKDLTKVKSKVLLNLTKRQLVCFSAGLLVGVPLFFLTKKPLGNSTAALLMILTSVGFQELPGFMSENYLKAAEMSLEDDYGMIDGIINNGQKPTVSDLEQQVKSGQSISLMDLAGAIQREKKPSVLKKLKEQPPQSASERKPRKTNEKEI